MNITRRSFLGLLAALCVSGVAHAASITRIGAVTASATTCTFTTHQAGDALVVWAMHGGATTIPALPSGYNSVFTKTESTSVALGTRVGYKIATSTSDASGTWTNASELICVVYRPSSGYSIGIGQSASSSSTTNTINYPALSPMADGSTGNSWVLGLVAASNLTQTLTTAFTGMTSVTSIAGTTYQAAWADTNAGVSSWASTNQTVTGTAGKSVSGTVELVLLPQTAPPNVYQHIKGGGNPYDQGQLGNAYKIRIPASVGSGNTMVLGFTVDDGATVSSVSGAVNGSLGTAALTVSGGTGNLDSYVYVLPNITSGQETITVTFSATVNYFSFEYTEYYGVASTFTATSGSTVQSAAYSTTKATGSFTPPNNNATGGNVVWGYFAKAEQVPAALTVGIYPGANFALLGADLGWNNANDSATHAAESYLQATSAAINPAVVSVADNTDHWNSMAVALKVSSGSGTAPGSSAYTASIHHFASRHFPASGNYVLQTPVLGNLRVLMSTDGNLNTQTITDNEGNIWTNTTTGFYYLLNSHANPNLKIYLTGGGADTVLSWRLLDIEYTGGTWTNDAGGTVSNGQVLNGLSSFTASPAPTPTSSTGITVMNIGLGQGPGLAITAPTGAVFTLSTYTGEADTDNMENADLSGYYIYSASGAQTWTMTITNQATNSSSGGFASFKETASAGCTHQGYTSAGALATPNGTSGSYVGKSGAFVTPDCSTINYWQPTLGNFGTTDLSDRWLDDRLRAVNDDFFLMRDAA